MLRSFLLRASTLALTVALAAEAAPAQESLPTIDIAGAQPDADKRPAPDPQAYRVENATTATKTSAPIMTVPASVQIVTRQILADQQVTQIGKAVENVSGVLAFDEKQSSNSQYFLIRGFPTPSYYRNGVRENGDLGGTGAANAANLDRVELLKGPASILYGRADPGGIINLVTKEPSATPFAAVRQQFGSYGFYRTTAEATGPASDDGSLLYRIDLSYEDSHTFQEFSGRRDFFVAPALRWQIDAATRLDVYLDYSRQHYPAPIFAPAYTSNDLASLLFGPRPVAFVPRGRNYNDPWARGFTDDIKVGFAWSHAFDESWKVTHRFQAELVSGHLANILPVAFDPVEPTQLARFAFDTPSLETHTYFTNLDVVGKFDTAGLAHELLVGGDFQHLDRSSYQVFPLQPTSNIDLFRPVHTNIRPLFDLSTRTDQAFRENWYGVFVQDHVALPFDLHLLAGGRYDRAETYDIIQKQTFDNSQRVTPRVGLLWRPLPEFSIYGSYLTNFGGPNVYGRRPLAPESAEQWEVGVKSELLDGKLSATLAYYNLTKQNIAVPDPDPALATQGYLKSLGEARNQGLELDVAGEVAPGLRLIASYSYIDSRITKDTGLDFAIVDANGAAAVTAGNTGKRLYNVPRHSGGLWATYDVSGGDLDGLKLGGGVVARDARAGDNANAFWLPAYATVGLMAGYDWRWEGRKIRAQINVDNLLDTRYYPESVNYQIGVHVGASRMIKGSIGVEF